MINRSTYSTILGALAFAFIASPLLSQAQNTRRAG